MYTKCLQPIYKDYDAQVGRENIFKPIVGKESLHQESNNNGMRLISLCTDKGLVISSTHFQRKDIYKYTWIAPGGQYKSQIDHVVIEKRFKSSINSVRSYRGADGDTDHYLVISSLKVKLSRQWNMNQKGIKKNARLDMDKIKNQEEITAYHNNLNNILESNKLDTELDSEKGWNIIKEAVNKAAYLFKKKTQTREKPWFDDECRDVIEKRSKARQEMIQDPTPEIVERYQDLRKIASKKIRNVKREYEKQKIRNIEEHRRNPRLFFGKCRSIKEGFKAKTNIVKDAHGCLITEESNIVEEFRKHFKELLSTTNEDVHPEEYQEHSTNYSVQPELPEPEYEEITQIIKSLKNNKAPGEDNINAELIKTANPKLISKIWLLIKEIWVSGKVPNDWKTAIICPIYKKGDPMETSNYRGISLLDTCYKVLSIAILRRIEVYTNDIIGDYQSGFMRGKSTTYPIFSIRQLLERYYEYGREVHLCFVDFKQAYDSIIRGKLWEALEEFGIPTKLIQLIKECNTETKCRVKFANTLSESFEVRTGLRQGDALSPILFNLALEKVIRSLPARQNMEILEQNTILAYADDIVIIGSSRIDVEMRTADLIKAAEPIGLKVNQEKTKYLVVSREERALDDMLVDGYVFQQVTDFKYLGTNINNRNNMHNEIKLRIASGNKGYYALAKLLKSKLLSRKSKEYLYSSFLRPVLTYGCETWSVTKGDEEKLSIFERKVLRRIYGPVIENGEYRRRTNQEVYQMFNKPIISSYLKSKRLEWAGHIWRSDGIAKDIFIGRLNGKRPRGRPRQRWEDRVKTDLTEVSEELIRIEDSEDRDRWKDVVEAAKVLNGL